MNLIKSISGKAWKGAKIVLVTITVICVGFVALVLVILSHLL